jgi:phosphatidylserine/phosphatidylglycerophosphate/cardiolipin synthase-like enzyme
MPTLDELKNKWFLQILDIPETMRESPPSLTVFGPPNSRIPGSRLTPYTDGNRIELLIDGKEILKDFHDRISVLTSLARDDVFSDPDQKKQELWICSWRLDGVPLLGQTAPLGNDAITKIEEAAEAGVKVYFLGSCHYPHWAHDLQIISERLQNLGSQGACDKRYQRLGSHHQKFNIFRYSNNSGIDISFVSDMVAVLGSADLSITRWDDSNHQENNSDRLNGPTHDIAVIVDGPATHDIAQTFVERWNDTTNRNRTKPEISTTISTDFLNTPIPPQGTCSVQVLRTYPIEPSNGYSWSNQGEFTIWASYLNAIKQATEYIYIEDQYFYPFSFPPAFENSQDHIRETDLVYQLGERIKDGVDVIVLVPRRS